ncbi:hypothetical protein DPEC_G00261500 [Dallia pectoralis]|uniref:Uncharacterized protein n=1 Tax=Dallia pectoralis TaxID=75939 RepID=A0ACC2FRI7_DALPE|nr:hypothetical protein DPEC_G00261500 [Dallia pectoralis]
MNTTALLNLLPPWNNTANGSLSESCQIQPQHVSITVFLLLVFVVGLVLNVFSVWVFCCRVPKWSSGTVLQFHLALSDVIVTPVAPLMATYFLMDSHWVFGSFMCKLKIVLLIIHFYGSILFLTLISIHRAGEHQLTTEPHGALNKTVQDNKVVYSPGESLSGTLNISTDQDLSCKDIKVNCQGFCGVTSKANDTNWAVEEQYFSSTLSVAEKGTLKRGKHAFPFKFLLPASTPTSFEGNYGKVMYRVRAFIDTPRFSKDYKTEKPFYLLSLFNLNEVPDIQGPSSSSVTKMFTYLLVKTGTVELKAQTDMKGYTPGQVIKITAKIYNQSGKSTGAVVAKLMQKVTYQTKKPTVDTRTLAQVEGAGVKAGKQAEWNEQIIVPPLPQSCLSGCELINLEYFIQISLKFPETSFLLPIHIGNISVDTTAARPSRPPPSNPDPPASEKPSQVQETPPTNPALRTAPKPAPRNRLSMTSPSSALAASPSAPPVDIDCQAIGAGGQTAEALPTKSHSQLDDFEPQAPVFPSAFSYAPGLTFSQNQPQTGPSNNTGPLFCLATGATIPFFSDGGANPMPTLYPLLPPEYSQSPLPGEAPPSYVESFNT